MGAAHRHLLAGALVLLAGASPAHGEQAGQAGPAPVMPPATDAAGRLFRALDQDRDGTLSEAEFRAGWQQLQRSEGQVRLRQQFMVLDTDHSGALDAKEYASIRLLKNAGKDAPALSKFDANGNGTLEFVEYASLVQKLLPRGGAGAGAGG